MAWKEPKVGELSSRIRIERVSEVSDGVGGFSTEWTPVLTSAAKIAPTKGGEEIRADRRLGIENVEITIPFSRSALTIRHSDRAIDVRTGKTYNIGWSGDLAGSQRYIVIEAQAGGLTDG